MDERERIINRFYSEIFDKLREEYDADEVTDMLEDAAFEEDDTHVIVTYDNGVQDFFRKALRVHLVHDEELSG